MGIVFEYLKNGIVCENQVGLALAETFPLVLYSIFGFYHTKLDIPAEEESKRLRKDI